MRSWIVGFVAGCLMFAVSPTAAQEARGTLQGRVSDSSGAVIPGATVEVSNVNTGITSPTTSNEEGNYRVPFLNPGTYRITVALDGFSKFVRQTSSSTSQGDVDAACAWRITKNDGSPRHTARIVRAGLGRGLARGSPADDS